MNKAVELMVRMYAENRIDPEKRGCSKLDRETIIGAMAMIAHDYPLGFALLEAKYVDDMTGAKKIYSMIRERLLIANRTISRPDLMPDLINMAIMEFCGKTLESQKSQLIELWMKFGSHSRRSNRIIKGHQAKINVLLRNLPTSEYRERENDKEIARYERLIENEVQRLRLYAENQAQKTDFCPACAGTGVLITSNNQSVNCYVCAGKGHHVINKEHVKRQFVSEIGVSEKLWRKELSVAYDYAVTLCHQESSFVARQLSEALERERNLN